MIKGFANSSLSHQYIGINVLQWIKQQLKQLKHQIEEQQKIERIQGKLVDIQNQLKNKNFQEEKIALI
ncbi:unnamed protein product [Paramecium sonneborni]|uniref:Uncharacterized protein n=1 Tax=Paramecium sonneborni TaxID=65129 RepID=A0A8S1M1C5_9CILI|nr:unnamed protein product [Paramecium sonneborni]